MSERERIIIAGGTGERTVQTTICTIVLSVEARAKFADEAQRQVADSSTELLSFLDKSGATKIETQGISLSPVHDYDFSPPKIVAYFSRNTITVEAPVKLAGMLMDGAVNAGATRINHIWFKATPGVYRDARLGAIEEAVKNARCEACTASRALGCILGDPVFIDLDPNTGRFDKPKGPRPPSPPPPPPKDMPVVPQEHTVSARVNVHFAIAK